MSTLPFKGDLLCLLEIFDEDSMYLLGKFIQSLYVDIEIMNVFFEMDDHIIPENKTLHVFFLFQSKYKLQMGTCS